MTISSLRVFRMHYLISLRLAISKRSEISHHPCPFEQSEKLSKKAKPSENEPHDEDHWHDIIAKTFLSKPPIKCGGESR